MAENDEMKKIAELYFGTQQVSKNLADVEKQLNSWINNLDSKYFKKLQTKFSGSFKLSSDTSSITKAAEKSMLRLNEIDAKRVATAARQDKALEIEQQKHLNRMEENEQKSLLRREEFSEKMAAKQQTMWDRIANMANTYLTYQGFNALKRAAQEVIDEMVNVENQMVQIDRVLNEDSLNIDNYRDKLINLAYQYGNSFDNVADITLRLAQAGFDSQQAMALTEKTLLALNTAELNATQATDDMIAVMSQWNLMTGSATEVANDYASIIDKVNRVADNFPTTSADIMDALKKTSSAFNMAGASIDETIASIVAAEKASQRGGKAIGTALNSMVQQLKTDKRLATMEGLGIDLYTDETKTEFKSIMDIFAQLSEKMEQLKKEGKESSVEMQNLLSVFTVLRRNVGGAFLGEMAGDDSTYNQVLNLVQAYDTMGYSIQENEKYMRTAKAAQEQFNATLLQLKTSVWENGAEDVFRSMLLLGTDIVKVFKTLIDTFGTLPTTVGMVVLAYSMLNKEMKLATMQVDLESKALTGVVANSKIAAKAIGSLDAAYKAGTISATTLKVATVALQAVYSLGLSVAITAIISLFNKLVHTEENARKKQQEIIDKANETISKNEQEAATIEKLIENYEKYSNVQMPENMQEREGLLKNIEESEKAVSEYLIQNNKYTAEMNGNYALQLKTLREINNEVRRKNLEEAQAALDAARKNQKGISTGLFGDFKESDFEELRLAGIDFARQSFDEYRYAFEGMNFDKQLEVLTQWKKQLQETGKVGTEAWEWVTESLAKLEEQEEGVEEQTARLNEMLRSEALEDFLSTHAIENVEDYKKALEDISNLELPKGYVGELEDYQAIMQQLVENTFPQYNENLENMEVYHADFNGAISEEVSTLEKLSTAYATLDTAIKEYNSSGEISISTFKSLVDNDLLDYLEVVNGKLQVNQSSLIAAANDAKEKAIADMQAEAAAEILSIAQADLNKSLQEEAGAAQTSANASEVAGNKALEAATKFIQGAMAVEEFNAALNGQGYSGKLSDQAIKDIDAVYERVKKRTAAINAISLSAAKTSGGASRSATKTFEQESSERVKIFKKEIDEMESLEQQWVNKFKKLELFGTDDLKFITHQRINRYNEYLNQINQLQGISEEDRNDLIREYSAERQKLELEYFDLLKQQLEEQIKALQEANKEKIQLIKDEAQAQIDALKAVDDENDRIRQKEEYEAKRQELLHGYQGVEYWRQRTGREAQLALAQAEKELAELDKDWEDKKKDWTLEDQIEEIEKARDAQIAAIEEAQEQQIAGWKAAYKAQIDLYAETGQIIYDNSVINAGYLYHAYMDNFVTPFNDRLRDVINTINAVNSATEAAAARAREVAAGNTAASGTAQNETTRASQVLQKSNSNITQQNNAYNKLSSMSPETGGASMLKQFKTMANKIGRLHGGGMVNTPAREALAILRPKEIVLTPEWAAGMDKLVQQVNSGKLLSQSATNTQIDVSGNLVNIDADIKNKQDADYLTKQITRVLQDKFNIKK